MDIGICDDDMKTLLSLKETVTEYCKSKGLEERFIFCLGRRTARSVRASGSAVSGY